MANISGSSIDKRDLLRKVGDISQIFGIRPIQYFSGKANLVKAYDIKTGSGLEFSVNENKCLDIFEMKFNGINLGFVSKAGLNSPYISDQRSSSFRYSQGCGMMYTAGLANVGGPCSDGNDEQYCHGLVKNIPAQNVSASGTWEEEKYKIVISGEMRESAFFGRNLVLNRRIETYAGSKSITITDIIENQDFSVDELMLLYHLNVGYPLLDDGAKFVVPAIEIEPMNNSSADLLDEYSNVSGPKDNAEELLYCIKMGKTHDGSSMAALLNYSVGLGLYVRYDATELDYLIEWKCMKSGEYAFGMLPSSCKPIGRVLAKEQGYVKKIKPFETWENTLEIGVLSSVEEMDECKSEILMMK